MQSSPQLLPPPAMPTPPSLPRRTSARNTRLHLRPEEPPIPPRLIGSPLLDKLLSPTASPTSKQRVSPKSAQEMWIDGDEFSVRKNGVPLAQSPPQAAPAPRYAPQQPPVPASFTAAGAKLGSPSTAKSPRPIAT